MEEAFNLDMLLEQAVEIELESEAEVESVPVVTRKYEYTVGIAVDEAFHFYYPDNLLALEEAGCRLVTFSPLRDKALPAGIDALYFGGGYPECKAAELAANTGMCKSIREFAGTGRVVYAECGGLMYLSDGIRTLDGEEHLMCGVLSVKVGMLENSGLWVMWRRRCRGKIYSVVLG